MNNFLEEISLEQFADIASMNVTAFAGILNVSRKNFLCSFKGKPDWLCL